MKNLVAKCAPILLFLIGIATSTNVQSQNSPFSKELYISKEGDTLKYRRLVSDSDPVSKYPLVIFLHGSGERGNDNNAQLQWGVHNFVTDQNLAKYRPIVIAPQCPKYASWGNYNYGDMTLKDSPTKTMKLLIELIKTSMDKLPIDPDRIYITGLSMGGYGTYDALARYPELFAAAVPVCGGGDTSKANVFAHIPMWIFHGALDNSVSPELSQKMVAALNKAGAHPGFTLYPDAGHFSWFAAYSDPMMMEWLFNQRK